MEIKVSISEQAFRDLVAGKVVQVAELTFDGKRVNSTAMNLKSHEHNCPQRKGSECTCGAFEHNEREMNSERYDLKIALQDIGWSRMYAALDDAYASHERDRG